MHHATRVNLRLRNRYISPKKLLFGRPRAGSTLYPPFSQMAFISSTPTTASSFNDGTNDPSDTNVAAPTVHVTAAAQNASISSSSRHEPQVINARAYQLEMLDQSLKKNVIVVMDTGSGKTQVAVLRIKVALEKSDSEKIIWYLAPTVSLCAQQFQVIKQQVTLTNMKLITGSENVDSWSPAIWRLILSNVRVVVSTPQIMCDALSHAFISMDRLALVVFDEAHNCVGNNPASKVMRNFYHRDKQRGLSVPCILGLTATPSIRSRVENMQTLESVLDAKCVTPTLHRLELRENVKKPVISCVAYDNGPPKPNTVLMQSLEQVSHNLDIYEDPRVLQLQSLPSERNERRLSKILERNKTNSHSQIKTLQNRSRQVFSQLGPWAADRYIWKACETYMERIGPGDDFFFDNWTTHERLYVARVIRRVVNEQVKPPDRPQQSSDLSDKACLLLTELLSAPEPVVGVVFAKDRAVVMMLCEVLASCPRIINRYRIGCIVGESQHNQRKRNLYDFLGNMDDTALDKFRTGKINLLVATAVLEEGIDVPACNLVVSFDLPDTPKAFVQRRGRARMKDSKLVMLSELGSSFVNQWEALEEQMKQIYEDEERQSLQAAQSAALESGCSFHFEVASTGATLDFENAKQHLEHFCSFLSRGEYIDSRPDYILTKHYVVSQDGTLPLRLHATVVLPPFVPPELRRVEGESRWLSEKTATKDAAFQAYMGLYEAGLVNEHLLPLMSDDEAMGVETVASEVAVFTPWNPWTDVARAWESSEQKWLYKIRYVEQSGSQGGDEQSQSQRGGEQSQSQSGSEKSQSQTGVEHHEYIMVFPAHLPRMRPMTLFLEGNKEYQVSIEAQRPITEEEAATIADDTSTLIALPFGHRYPVLDKQQVVKIAVPDGALSRQQIGAVPFDLQDPSLVQGNVLVRDVQGVPFYCHGVLDTKPPKELVKTRFHEYELAADDEPYLVLSRLTKEVDFLHPRQQQDGTALSTERYAYVLPQKRVTVDQIAAKHVKLGMMIPCIVHELEVMLRTAHVSTCLLHSVGITDAQLVREAISTPYAREPVNYERLEFVGDSVLKLCASMQAAAENPHWPEGYLSLFRDRLVANSRLCRCTLESRLSKLLVNEAFTGRRWRPLYVDDLLQQTDHDASEEMSAKAMSSKTLADVIEALIGASHIDGGYDKALSCISVFFPERDWKTLEQSRDELFNLTQSDEPLPGVLEPLEELLGHSFSNKTLLIEAMTHGSYSVDADRRSYERLEFLGDAILDRIIVSRVFAVEPPLPHSMMHLYKTAMVNADFLAFVVLENGLMRSEPVLGHDLQCEMRETKWPIWKFMRHGAAAIGLEQAETVKRHDAVRKDILAAMEQGTRYPWALLARLQANKFFSDLFEALVGAIWIDSGSMEACQDMVRRFGVLSYLDRILRDGVQVLHPKEELGHLALSQTVTYEVDFAESIDSKARYSCSVLVGNELVARVDDGLASEEARVKAAEMAVEVLMARKAEATSHGETTPHQHDAEAQETTSQRDE